MSLEFRPHPRGIVITVPSSIKRSDVGNRIRTVVPSRNVLLDSGQYIVPAEYAYKLRTEFSNDEAIWDARLIELSEEQGRLHNRIEQSRYEVADALSRPFELLHDYRYLQILDTHQVEAVAAMTTLSLVGLAIFDEQGLGKTIMGLCAFDRLHELRMINQMLVVAPKSVIASWLDDIQKLFNEKYVTKVVEGTHDSRRRRIRSNADILLTNYESVVSELNVFKRMLGGQRNKTMLIVDESYYVKNPNARRSKAVSEIRSYCDRAIILCGTPAPNSPQDLLHQLDIADTGVSRLNNPIPDDEAIAEYVKEVLDNAIYLRRLKRQAIPDIPEKQVERVGFDLQPVQRSLYEYAHKDIVLAVRSVDDKQFARQIASFLALRSNLLQICSHPGAIDPLYEETPAKHLVLDRMLDELIEHQNQKVVIWSYYRFSAQALVDRYSRYGVVRIDGTVKSMEERREAIHRFQNDPSVNLFIGNAAAAGAGITLTAARHAIYESYSNQAAHYMQSIDRIHRRGQTHDVTIHILIAGNTLEETQYERLADKERLSKELLGDKDIQPMTRERFLSDLGAMSL